MHYCGAMVKRLRRYPLKVESGVQFSLALPILVQAKLLGFFLLKKTPINTLCFFHIKCKKSNKKKEMVVFNMKNQKRGTIMDIFQICNYFNINAKGNRVISKGLINNSWEIIDEKGESYIVQEINSNVFKDVDSLMDNISRVTQHVRKKVKSEGGDVNREGLTLMPTNSLDKNGKEKYYYTNGTKYYRMYKCIKDASTYDQADEELLYQAGVGFGKFQRMLSDFPANTLHESIKDFHNTAERYNAFEKKLDYINIEYYHKAGKEIRTALKGFEYADKIMRPLREGKIPTRVVHNDTKLNNVMLDNKTHGAVCVIDLDTIMPGSILFDYGDAIRYCANNGAEDDRDLNNVSIDIKKFNAFTYGFLSQTASTLTNEELKLMCVAPAVLTYELGLRFLTDYLDGNKYFKCDPSRPDHNLERARAQFKLFEEFKKHEKDMDFSIHAIYNKCMKENAQKEAIKKQNEQKQVAKREKIQRLLTSDNVKLNPKQFIYNKSFLKS